MTKHASLLTLFLGSIIPAATQANDVWKVPVAAFKCIQENADAYLTTVDEPIIIVVAACPVIDVAEALSITAKNSGLLSVGGGDSVLILTREELLCLVSTALEEDQSGLVSISKDNACDPS